MSSKVGEVDPVACEDSTEFCQCSWSIVSDSGNVCICEGLLLYWVSRKYFVWEKGDECLSKSFIVKIIMINDRIINGLFHKCKLFKFKLDS